MIEIAFVADEINEDNGLQSIYENISNAHTGVADVSFDELEKTKPKFVITNQCEYLPDITSKYPTMFILTQSSGAPLLQPGLRARRLLMNSVKAAQAVVVYSSFAAKEMEKNYKIKPVVQLPVVKRKEITYDPRTIVCSEVPRSIHQLLPGFKFISYSNAKDLDNATLYIDMTSGYECSNIRLCLAAARGIPCVAKNNLVNAELASGGDILLPENSPPAKWVEAIRLALRDRGQNSEKNKYASLRFQNMGDINNRINRSSKNKTANLPRIANRLKEQEIEDKINRLNKTRKQNNPNSPVKVRKVMGRRETLAERERRARRAMQKDRNSVKPGSIPSYEVVSTPSWFTSNSDCDVSIIVPMHKSRAVISRQIREWDTADDGLKKEIIYVDDLCPQKSHDHIIECWESKRSELRSEPVGKIIKSHVNRGYGPACNLGAKHASGKYLIFLNADVYVTPNWVKPMYDLCESDPKIGIVGNMHLKTQSNDGEIDSAGSEWAWSGGHFEHIGRSVYQGNRIPPLKLNELPDDLKKVDEREMVTGCCFMIPRTVFDEIAGYDEMYRTGYWEDSDMNMSVKELGYKIMFTPESKILHVGGHSRAGGHQHMKTNRERFFNRWVHSGFVDKIASQPRPETRGRIRYDDLKSSVDGEVVGCIIACNEEEFLEVSVRSIAPIVDRFVFVIGGNQYAFRSGMCDEKGYPKDNTLQIAKSLSKEFNGTVIEPPGRLWQGKTEMRNRYVEHLNPGNWMFMLDGDEVYKPGQLWVISNLMRKYECLHLQYYAFWNNVNTIGVGAWDNYPQERIVRWKSGYQYKSPNHLFVAASDGSQIAHRVPTYMGQEKLFYHYSWVRPLEKIKQKIKYYENQLKSEWKQSNAVHKNYFDDIFMKWRLDRNSVKYTHLRGGGECCDFGGIHPYGVTKLIQEGKLDF